MAKPPTRRPSAKERKLMREHIAAPHLIPQIEVIKRLKIPETNSFYRLFYRCMKEDTMERVRNAE